jgi:hypothetical protein
MTLIAMRIVTGVRRMTPHDKVIRHALLLIPDDVASGPSAA